MTKPRPERRAADRPLKRVRQLQVRLDTLLRDARALRAEGAARTRNALAVKALLELKRGVSG
jgi:hypothetical protein